MNMPYVLCLLRMALLGHLEQKKINDVSKYIYVSHRQLDVWLLPHLGPSYALLVGWLIHLCDCELYNSIASTDRIPTCFSSFKFLKSQAQDLDLWAIRTFHAFVNGIVGQRV